MPDVLRALEAFTAEHQRLGEPDGGKDDAWVWLTCCGARIVHATKSTCLHPGLTGAPRPGESGRSGPTLKGLPGESGSLRSRQPTGYSSLSKIVSISPTPPPAASRKKMMARPGYPKIRNGVSTRMSRAAPMMRAASRRPSVMRLATF